MPLYLKRFVKLFFFIICLSTCLFIILNMPVTSQQGVNYAVKTLKMPLYIKIIEFLDRDYHYKELARRICQEYRSDEDKVLAIFAWTQQNIKTNIPEGWPVIDDHVWHIIIRGYGANDQFQDVFTTLCNYAKLDAFFCRLSKNSREKITFSFVRLRKEWSVFDAYNGIYFKNKKGELANIKDLLSGEWQLVSITESTPFDYQYYKDYFKNLYSINYDDWIFTRPAIQSPLRRFLYQIKRKEKIRNSD